MVLNEEQHVQPAQQHRVHVEEVHCQDAFCLGRGSLPPSLVGLADAADRSTDLVPRPRASAGLCAVTRSTVTDASSVPIAPCRQESAISPGQKSVNRPISGQY
jgi:hypothetical protein